MPVVTLPDGSKREFDHPVTVREVDASIGAGLAKAALGARVDGSLVDTSYTIDRDATLAIVTDRSDEALEIIRHCCRTGMSSVTEDVRIKKSRERSSP